MNPIQNIYLYYIDLFVGYLDILCYIYIYIYMPARARVCV
jgi:hypothetical protein